MRRQSYIYIITISMLALLVLPVSAHWAEPHAVWLVEKGYLKVGDRLLEDLDEPAVRGDIAKLAVSILGGEEEYPSEPMYTDVAEDNPYFTVCQKAGELGYIAGFEDGTFRPYDLVSRQDTFAILGRAFKITGGTQDIFIDSKEIGEYAKPYVNGLKEQGIVNGYPDGTVKPEGEITVGELLTIAHFLAEEQETKPEVTPTPTTTPTSVPTPVPTKPIGSGSGPGGNSRPSPTPTPTVKPEGPKIQIEKIMEEYVDEETGEKTGESVKPIELTVKADKPDEVEEIRWMRLSEPEGDRTYEEIWKSNGSELLDGSRLEVRKNGRYLFCVTGKNGGKTYVSQDVTEIYRPRFTNAPNSYSDHWDEYTQISFFDIYISINNFLSTEVDDSSKYTMYWGPYVSIENVDEVFKNDMIEKELKSENKMEYNTLNIRENGKYNAYIQDAWGNCCVYTFEVNETHEPKVRATLLPRESQSDPAKILIETDEKTDIYEKRWMIYRVYRYAHWLPRDVDDRSVFEEQFEYSQPLNDSVVERTEKGYIMEVKRSGRYGFYVKTKDGKTDMHSVKVMINGPQATAEAVYIDNDMIEVSVTLLQENPNARIVKMGWGPALATNPGDAERDTNYKVEEFMESEDFHPVDGTTFTASALNGKKLYLQDEWGNCSIEDIKLLYNLPGIFLRRQMVRSG